MTEPFNPLSYCHSCGSPSDMETLTHSIVERMMNSEPAPLGEIERFTGAGVYSIHYFGDFDAYSLLTAAHKRGDEIPIYVGKAVPSGARRGLNVTDITSTRTLSSRINQHAASIRAATNLNIDDFQARWLITEDIWIPFGESALIREYKPVWNAIVDGFGNHDPGKGRINGVRPRWDTVHPGRPWAEKFPARSETAEDIKQEIREYLRSRIF